MHVGLWRLQAVVSAGSWLRAMQCCMWGAPDRGGCGVGRGALLLPCRGCNCVAHCLGNWLPPSGCVGSCHAVGPYVCLSGWLPDLLVNERPLCWAYAACLWLFVGVCWVDCHWLTGSGGHVELAVTVCVPAG